MLVYRLCGRPYTALDGEGARLYGGRWNSSGQPVVYTSTHLSLAVLEYLVHVDFDNLPSDLVWVKIEISDAVTNEVFPHSIAPNERESVAFGDDWLQSRRSLILMVPSAVLSVERNVILNPAHIEMHNARIVEINTFEFDHRLFN